MAASSWSIARFGPTSVRMHWSFLLLLGWFALVAGLQAGLAAALNATLFIVLLFVSVVAHEFGHVAAARRFGVRTREILLLPIGGMAKLDRANVFDIGLLAHRLVIAAEWAERQPRLVGLPIGLFGASTGAGAALVAAASAPDLIAAVVSRGGRPDLADAALAEVRVPVLLIVGGDDAPVISLNEQALGRLAGEKKMVIVSGAGHLFEEAGTLDTVIDLATHWFIRKLVHERAQ